jgi:uncharacterized integral membrane protein
MDNLKRVVVVAVLLLLAVAILAFMLENQQAVSLFFLGWEGPRLPVAIYVSLALLCGAVIGPLLMAVQKVLRGRRRLM